jgi:hypothetical protein
MISSLINIFLKKIFFSQSIFLKVLGEIIAISLTVVLIYFASESFEINSKIKDEMNSSIFSFLLVGEISLVLGMSLASVWLNTFIELRNQQFYQTLIGLGLSPQRFSFSRAISDSIFPLIRIIVIILLGFSFKKINLNIYTFGSFMFLQVISIFIYALFAMITSLIYLKFNRGIGLYYSLQTVSAILGGAYFPISVFPFEIKNIAEFLPQTQILKISREIFSNQLFHLNTFWILIVWSTFLLLVWYFLNIGIIHNLKKKNRFF